jgi:hypothetical protein
MHLLVELHGQPGWVAALTDLEADDLANLQFAMADLPLEEGSDVAKRLVAERVNDANLTRAKFPVNVPAPPGWKRDGSGLLMRDS